MKGAVGEGTKKRGDLIELRLVHECGATAAVMPQGAQVTSWIAPGGEDVLFVGSTAEFAAGRTLRGGIPVVFPQFAELGSLPKHGIVRTLDWQVREHRAGVTVLGLTSSAATRPLWPREFSLKLGVELRVDTLLVSLDVENTGNTPFSFTCALHTYLRVSDVDRATVRGLSGCTYLDKTRDVRRCHDGDPQLLIRGETDRVYLGSPAVELHDQLLARAVRVQSTGFTNVVIWNPGPDRVQEFSGLAADDHRNFICVEPAVVTQPVVLEPAGTWNGTQALTVRPLD